MELIRFLLISWNLIFRYVLSLLLFFFLLLFSPQHSIAFRFWYRNKSVNEIHKINNIKIKRHNKMLNMTNGRPVVGNTIRCAYVNFKEKRKKKKQRRRPNIFCHLSKSVSIRTKFVQSVGHFVAMQLKIFFFFFFVLSECANICVCLSLTRQMR